MCVYLCVGWVQWGEKTRKDTSKPKFAKMVPVRGKKEKIPSTPKQAHRAGSLLNYKFNFNGIPLHIKSLPHVRFA
jgi:hypothetical protein